ncbi:hypothetical protein ABEG17_08425 [Pedococcus sp. KACC 23699]|uniref:Uncharacterized protein n=1 Tax=Pedococcus sp. KACC 23699 TaxID=3149228 RepID=A0AAU7JYL9_9MICO
MALSVGVALGVAGCSSGPGGETTCADFAAMSPDTGLMTKLSDKQTQVIDKMLSDHNRSASVSNEMLAQLQITQYCNIYGGKAGSNTDKAIENIGGLQ